MNFFSRPVHYESLGRRDLRDLLLRLPAGASSFLLESGLNPGDMGRWHLLGAHSVGSFVAEGDAWRWTVGVAEGDGLREDAGEQGAWTALEVWWREWSADAALSGPTAGSPGANSGFAGGAVGYLGYEFGELAEGLPPRPEGRKSRDVHLELFDEGVIVDATSGEAWAFHRDRDGREARRWWDGAARSVASPWFPGHEELSLEREAYLQAVDAIREEIRWGDVYEVNLTRRHRWPGRGDPWELYLRLRDAQPVPYAAFLPWSPYAVLSASPERFLHRRGSYVDTRPIKGTIARGATEAEDAAHARELLASKKDRAELAMIIDLERNDLGRVCVPGSVRVVEEAAVETYASVLHTVATVCGELPEDFSPISLLRATFPGGSITGAPKIAAMQSIRRHEPVPRHAYTGSVGWIGPNGDLELSIAIRTVLLTPDATEFSVGGAITWDSTPAAEYDELAAKGEAIFRALGGGEGISLDSE